MTGSGCSPPEGGVGEPARKQPRPSYYPGDYDEIVDASKQEGGSLTIYSNMDSYNWQPIIDGFQGHYPWIEKVNTTNFGSSEVFQRHQAEASKAQARASLLVSGDPINWRLMSERELLEDYQSPEKSELPEFGHPLPGVYVCSADVILTAYNKILLDDDEYAKSLEAIAQLATEESDRFANKITTYSTSSGFGLAIHLAYFRALRQIGSTDPWAIYDRLLPYTRAEESSGPMLDKIATGEYLIGYFMSSTIVFPQQAQIDKVVGWDFCHDASLMFLRGMGVPSNCPQPNSAKLMLDYLISYEGQVNIGRGGFTPFRDDVTPEQTPVTYHSVREEVGSDNIVIIGFDLGSEEEQEDFNHEWESRLG